MPVLRVLVTIGAGLALLFALVTFGHLLPWHRDAPGGSPATAAGGPPPAPVLAPSKQAEPSMELPDLPPIAPAVAAAHSEEALAGSGDDGDRDGDDEDDDVWDEGKGKHGKKWRGD